MWTSHGSRAPEDKFTCESMRMSWRLNRLEVLKTILKWKCFGGVSPVVRLIFKFPNRSYYSTEQLRDGGESEFINSARWSRLIALNKHQHSKDREREKHARKRTKPTATDEQKNRNTTKSKCKLIIMIVDHPLVEVHSTDSMFECFFAKVGHTSGENKIW